MAEGERLMLPEQDRTEYKKYVSARLRELMPLMQKYALGDFSEELSIPEKEDEFTELVVGMKLMLEDMKEMIDEREEMSRSWQKTFDSTKDLFMLLDQDYRIIRANQATIDFLKLPPEKILGRHCYELMHGTKEPHPTCPLAKLMKSKKHEEGELYLKERGIWAIITVDPIFDNNGNLTGVVHVVRDMTERHKLDQVIKENEESFRMLLEQSPIATVICDIKGVMRQVNKAFERLWGIKAATVLGKFSFLDEPQVSLTGIKPFFKKVMNGKIQVMPDKLFDPREAGLIGNARWLRTVIYPLLDQDKKVKRIVLLQQDITARKEAEMAISESEQKYRGVVDSAAEGIVSLDMSGKITQINPRALKISGFKYDEIIGKRFVQLLPRLRMNRRELIPAFKDMISGKDLTKRDWQFTNLYGAEVIIRVEYSPLIREGRQTGLTIIFDDVTEERQLEKQKDSLVINLSHELKTPIAMTEMALDMLARDIAKKDLAKAKKTMKIAETNINRLRQDVRNVLEIFSLGVKQPKVSRLSLKKVINEVVAELGPMIKAKRLKVKLDLKANARRLNFPKEHLLSLFRNLLDNAIKFTDQGTITIASRADGKMFFISVRDTGRGIMKKDLRRVFDRFYKGVSAMAGAGLGMSICKQIVEINKGTIEVASKGSDKGTIVKVALPGRK